MSVVVAVSVVAGASAVAAVLLVTEALATTGVPGALLVCRRAISLFCTLRYGGVPAAPARAAFGHPMFCRAFYPYIWDLILHFEQIGIEG
ncbi:hypothetical protein [Bordetella flabilis]|nr:hypothetical protein [Bordetella flabilis]